MTDFAPSSVTNKPLSSDQFGFERLIAEIASCFAVLDLDEFDRAVTTTLGRVGTFLGVDRCFIFVLSDDGAHHRVAHVWTERDLPQDQVVVGMVVQDEFPWVGDRMLSREEVDRIGQADKRPFGELPYARSAKKGVYTKKLRSFPVGIDAAA